LRERPLEPDTDNSGVGIREKRGNRIPKGMRFFYFMRLEINGEVVDGVRASTVQELLDEMKITAGRVAVEVNLSVVRKADFGHFRLNEGDAVEIVNFVGGG
jgi:sulfur carrier protein